MNRKGVIQVRHKRSFTIKSDYPAILHVRDSHDIQSSHELYFLTDRYRKGKARICLSDLPSLSIDSSTDEPVTVTTQGGSSLYFADGLPKGSIVTLEYRFPNDTNTGLDAVTAGGSGLESLITYGVLLYDLRDAQGRSLSPSTPPVFTVPSFSPRSTAPVLPWILGMARESLSGRTMNNQSIAPNRTVWNSSQGLVSGDEGHTLPSPQPGATNFDAKTEQVTSLLTVASGEPNTSTSIEVTAHEYDAEGNMVKTYTKSKHLFFPCEQHGSLSSETREKYGIKEGDCIIPFINLPPSEVGIRTVDSSSHPNATHASILRGDEGQHLSGEYSVRVAPQSGNRQDFNGATEKLFLNERAPIVRLETGPSH